MDLERFAKDIAAKTACTHSSLRVAMPLAIAASTHLTFGNRMHQLWLTHLTSKRAVQDLVAFLQDVEKQIPIFDGKLGPLVEWARREDEQTLATVQQVAGHYLKHADALVEYAQGEDWLGVLYSFLRSSADRSHGGAFFTPLDIASLLAAMHLSERPPPGSTFYGPTCGTGTMFWALGRRIRQLGGEPAAMGWYGQDLDPMAVALCSMNLVAWGLVQPGMPSLELTRLIVGNTLLNGHPREQS